MTQVQAPVAAPPDEDVRAAGRLDRYFHLAARGSTVSREVRGGLTTFFAMAYIVLLNPIIIGSAADVTGAHLSIGELTTATAFGSLWLSSHPGTSSMGKLLALSLVTTLAAVLLFQPALMGKPRDVG